MHSEWVLEDEILADYPPWGKTRLLVRVPCCNSIRGVEAQAGRTVWLVRAALCAAM
jgi:hypothetical protein